MATYGSGYHCDGSLQRQVNFRFTEEDHYHLRMEAEKNNRSLSSHLRHVAIDSLGYNRSSTTKNTKPYFNPQDDFGEYLATALAMILVWGLIPQPIMMTKSKV